MSVSVRHIRILLARHLITLTIVIGYSDHGGSNQRVSNRNPVYLDGAPDGPQWMFDREDDGWTIRSLESGMYVGVENWSTSDGSKVVSVEEKYVWHIWREEGSDEHFR